MWVPATHNSQHATQPPWQFHRSSSSTTTTSQLTTTCNKNLHTLLSAWILQLHTPKSTCAMSFHHSQTLCMLRLQCGKHAWNSCTTRNVWAVAFGVSFQVTIQVLSPQTKPLHRFGNCGRSAFWIFSQNSHQPSWTHDGLLGTQAPTQQL